MLRVVVEKLPVATVAVAIVVVVARFGE